MAATAQEIRDYPWVVVVYPGTDAQYVFEQHRTMRDALDAAKDGNKFDPEEPIFDVMKRLPDGTLTTEF